MISEIITLISLITAGANGAGMIVMYIKYIRLVQSSQEFAAEIIGSIVWNEDGEPVFTDPLGLASGGIKFLTEIKDQI